MYMSHTSPTGEKSNHWDRNATRHHDMQIGQVFTVAFCTMLIMYKCHAMETPIPAT